LKNTNVVVVVVLVVVVVVVVVVVLVTSASSMLWLETVTLDFCRAFLLLAKELNGEYN